MRFLFHIVNVNCLIRMQSHIISSVPCMMVEYYWFSGKVLALLLCVRGRVQHSLGW